MAEAAGGLELGHVAALLAAGVVAVPVFRRLGFDVVAAATDHEINPTNPSTLLDWVPDAEHWRERTRGIEDKLSDALHDRLTDQDRGILARSPFCLLATSDARGGCDVSPRGDAPGH